MLKTYRLNQENAKAFAEMAMQSHNLRTGKIMDSITAAADGLLRNAVGSELYDGGKRRDVA